MQSNETLTQRRMRRPQRRHAVRSAKKTSPNKLKRTSCCFAAEPRDGARWIAAKTSSIQTIAETAVIAAKASAGIRPNPAEMYAGSLVPGKNRLRARLNRPTFLLGLLA